MVSVVVPAAVAVESADTMNPSANKLPLLSRCAIVEATDDVVGTNGHQSAAAVGVSFWATNIPTRPARTSHTVLAPLDWTVTVPDDWLHTMYVIPAVTDVVGNFTVCVVEPVKTWTAVSAMVKVVVPAAVAVEVTDGMNASANRFALLSRCAIFDAVAAVTAVHADTSPLATVPNAGVVNDGDTNGANWTVAPLIRAKTPDVVDHTSPSAGADGAEPGGTFNPARVVDDANVTNAPANVATSVARSIETTTVLSVPSS